MKHIYLGSIFISFLLIIHTSCEKEEKKVDYSGTYCLNIQNLEMIIVQEDGELTFTVQNDLLVDGSGNIIGDTLVLSARTSGSESFTCKLAFTDDLQQFSGPYFITDDLGQVFSSGILMGIKGNCDTYNIDLYGVPEFIESDFTQLDKIGKISKFRSGAGHSFTDGTESCRSMKHYFSPYAEYMENRTIEIYSRGTGTITSVLNDGHGASEGLTNKAIQIRPDDQPAFTCELFHCDLVSDAVGTGKKVQAGELLGHARLYYDDLEEYANSFDVAIWAQTPSGPRLISYFDALLEEVFGHYISRGIASKDDLIISREARDADPIQCDGDGFLSEGTLENWVTLIQPTAHR